MKRKILSVLIALAMLGQSAYAGVLNDHITDWITILNTDLGTDLSGMVNNGVFEVPGIGTTITATAKEAGAGTYTVYDNSAAPLSTKNGFDYKVSLDLSGVKAEFDQFYAWAIASIEANGGANEGTLKTAFNNSVVSGNFTVTVEYDSRLDRGANVFAFGQEGLAIPEIFEVVEPIDYSTNPVLVNFKVKNNPLDPVTVDDIKNSANALNDLYVTLSGVTTNTTNTSLEIKAKLTSATVTLYDDSVVTEHLANSEKFGVLTFTSDEKKVYVSKPSSSTSSGGISYPKPTTTPTATPSVTIVVDGEETSAALTEEDGKMYLDVASISDPEKEGFAFDGWYQDPYYAEEAEGKIEVTESIKLYPKFINTTAPVDLIAGSHDAYIVGYTDGEVKPENNITREEVAAIFYRLLTPIKRAEIETAQNPFPDVADDKWSIEEIATLANGGYIVGDENGNFNPDAPITRAAFATIASKFVPDMAIPEVSYFTDIAGHWGENNIKKTAYGCYWIFGYNGLFRPDDYITRAEAMAIINRMLVRYGDVDSEYAKDWPDLSKDDWYYGAVIEATTSHTYERAENGWQEIWTAAIEY